MEALSGRTGLGDIWWDMGYVVEGISVRTLHSLAYQLLQSNPAALLGRSLRLMLNFAADQGPPAKISPEARANAWRLVHQVFTSSLRRNMWLARFKRLAARSEPG